MIDAAMHNGHDATGRRRFTAVLLAGALRPSPLRQELDVPVLTLPIAREHRLLDLWLASLERTQGCDGVKIVVSSRSDAESTYRSVQVHHQRLAESSRLDVEVLVDPRDWRGPGGLLLDIARHVDLPNDDLIIAAEAACLPPPCLESMVAPLPTGCAGVVGGGDGGEPAGVFAFTREAVETIPSIGFFDIKEQFLPSLYASGMGVRASQIVGRVHRIRDRESYLRAIEVAQIDLGVSADRNRRESISPKAHIAGCCVVEDDVVIEDGAIVHQSAALSGAVIQGGAVVSRCIIGPDTTVPARTVLKSTTYAALPRQPRPMGILKQGQLSKRLRIGSLLPSSNGGTGK